MSTELVLVTGASGYLGSHCVRALLENGYRVRGTVRNLQNSKLVDPVRALDKSGHLTLVEADLLKPETWPKAVKGVDYVLHVASPISLQSDEQTIKTALEGTMNVLKAAAQEKSIKKVVLTSSGLAVFDGHTEDIVYDETLWGIPDKAMNDYSRSKIIAEKAAWEFYNSLPANSRFAFTVINPTLIVGPQIIEEGRSSALLIGSILGGKLLHNPPRQFVCVDVRDAALAHVKALKSPASDGQRILATDDQGISAREVIEILAKEFQPQGYNLPSTAELATPRPCKITNAKSKQQLGMKYRPIEKSLVEMGYALIEHGVVQKTAQYRGVPAGVALT